MLQSKIKTKVITMIGKEISETLSRAAIDSCKEHNIDAEIHHAVWGEENVIKEYEKYQLRPFYNIKKSRDTLGVRGCFLSHFQLWKEVIETKEPMLILEHDALVIKDIPDSILNYSFGVLNLDAYSRTAEDYEEHLNKPLIAGIRKNIVETPAFSRNWQTFDDTSIKGLHAYIIKPAGAKDLIEFTYEYGVLPADVHVNSISCNLLVTNSSLCRVNPTYWLPKKRKSINSYTRTDP